MKMRRERRFVLIPFCLCAGVDVWLSSYVDVCHVVGVCYVVLWTCVDACGVCVLYFLLL